MDPIWTALPSFEPQLGSALPRPVDTFARSSASHQSQDERHDYTGAGHRYHRSQPLGIVPALYADVNASASPRYVRYLVRYEETRSYARGVHDPLRHRESRDSAR